MRHRNDLTVTASVIPQAAGLIESRLGPTAETRLRRLVTSTRFTIIDLVTADYQRSIELIDTYSHLGLGLVDASIIAERLGQTTIATLNHCDFAVIRPAHRNAFEIVP